MVLEKTLESPLDSSEIKPIQKEIKPEYSLEGLLLKLKLQYFGHLMQRAHSLKKTLMPGKIEGKKGSGRQRMRWLDITNSMDMNLSKLQETVKDWGGLAGCSPWGRKESDMTQRLNNNKTWGGRQMFPQQPELPGQA